MSKYKKQLQSEEIKSTKSQNQELEFTLVKFPKDQDYFEIEGDEN